MKSDSQLRSKNDIKMQKEIKKAYNKGIERDAVIALFGFGFCLFTAPLMHGVLCHNGSFAVHAGFTKSAKSTGQYFWPVGSSIT